MKAIPASFLILIGFLGNSSFLFNRILQILNTAAWLLFFQQRPQVGWVFVAPPWGWFKEARLMLSLEVSIRKAPVFSVYIAPIMAFAHFDTGTGKGTKHPNKQPSGSQG